jgi:hypothetical protein
LRNLFSKTTLRHLIVRISSSRRRGIRDDIAGLRADTATLGESLERVAERIEALHEGDARAASALADLFTALDRGMQQNREQMAPYLPRRRFESFDVSHFARLQAAETSAMLFNKYLYAKPTFAAAEELLAHCLNLLSGKATLPLEFGVFSGRTINAIADVLGPEIAVYGFDSFEGLPETWRSKFREGHFAVDALPKVRPNVSLVKGWFEDTLPQFRDQLMGPDKTNFIHVDCDLYSSTRTIFSVLADNIAEDAILVFDEFFNYPGWEQHEYRAFAEYIASSGRGFEFIGSVPVHQQVAVRLRPTAAGSPILDAYK